MVIRRLIAPHIDFSALRRELKLPRSSRPRRSARPTQIAASGPGAARASTAPTSPFVTIDPPTSMDLDQAMCLRAPGRRRLPRVTTRSPTCPPSSRPAARSRRRPGSAARRSTCPTARCRCTRRSCPRAPPACCRTRSGRPCCGRSTSTPTVPRPRSGSSAPRCAAGPSSNYPAVQARCRRPARSTTRSRCCPRSAKLLIERGLRARRHQPADPGAGGRAGRRRRLGAGAARRPRRSRTTTRRSRC